MVDLTGTKHIFCIVSINCMYIILLCTSVIKHRYVNIFMRTTTHRYLVNHCISSHTEHFR